MSLSPNIVVNEKKMHVTVGAKVIQTCLVLCLVLVGVEGVVSTCIKNNCTYPLNPNIIIQGKLTHSPTKVDSRCVKDSKKVNKQANPAPGSPKIDIDNN